MTRILRVVSVSRGLDPRDFALIAFGGAGPLHAAELAADLGIPRVIVPEAPGLFSALGLLWADLRADFSRTVRLPIAATGADALGKLLVGLEVEAAKWLARERVATVDRTLLRTADMRYPLQNYEINVPIPAGPIDADWIVRCREAFHVAHERLYGYCDVTEEVQAINFRVAAIGRTAHGATPRIEVGGTDPRAAQKAERRVYFLELGDRVGCPVYERDRLLAGNAVAGPAIVEQPDSTIVVPPSFAAVVDPHGRLLMTAGEQ